MAFKRRDLMVNLLPQVPAGDGGGTGGGGAGGGCSCLTSPETCG